MKRKWFGDRAHIDEAKVEEKAKAKKELRQMIETGDEEGYIARIKMLRPDLSPGDLVRLIELFREQRRPNR